MVRRGWSRRYVNRQIVRVRTIFKWGVAQGLVSPNTHAVLCAVDGLRAGQTDAMDYPPVAPVAQDRIDAIMPFVPAVIADMVRVQLLTGMRPGELCSLKPSEIDKTAPVWVYKPSDHKLLHRGRVRMIAIGPRAQAILMTYLTHRPLNARVFSPIDAQQQRREAQHAARQTPLSCGNRPGTNRVRRRIRSQRDYYTSTTYARAIRYACEAAWPHATITGIPAAERTKEQVAALKAWNDEHLWTPNQLRHSAATRIRSEAGLEMARAVLGHSTFAVTEIFYAELDMAKVSTLMRKIG